MTRLFDAYIAVDWSARSKPSPRRESKDSVWLGELVVGQAHRDPYYFQTRGACVSTLRTLLSEHVAAKRRVLVGFDFPYGYPRGFANALGLIGVDPPWRQIWTELARTVIDESSNQNNRFDTASELNSRFCRDRLTAGPFWGCPVGLTLPHLTPTSPPFPFQVAPTTSLERLRITEQRIPGVQPAWKLWGNGSVGGQSLLGIPRVSALCRDPEFAAASRIWPFETGFGRAQIQRSGPFVLHAEIWPGLVKDVLDPTASIRDKAQVQAMVRWLSNLDGVGRLGELFDTPEKLTAWEESLCTSEEGWILGVR